jgi:hypothetical protein
MSDKIEEKVVLNLNDLEKDVSDRKTKKDQPKQGPVTTKKENKVTIKWDQNKVLHPSLYRTSENENLKEEVKGFLRSSLPNPVTVGYGKEQLRISPKGKTGSVYKSKLPKVLPKGVIFIEQ